MTEKESLELITQMIQNSKKNLRLGNVNILLLWGYLLYDNCTCGLCSDSDNW